MALEIEDYALIGDCETAALVGKDGSIDWLCWPDFSSPACFAALVGTEQNGRWLLAPKNGCKRITRRYREHTLILETRFETATGILLVTDFMPVRETHSDLVRIARCLEGSVTVQMELCVRFDYGRTIPWTGPREGNTWAAAAGTRCCLPAHTTTDRDEKRHRHRRIYSDTGRTSLFCSDLCSGTRASAHGESMYKKPCGRQKDSGGDGAPQAPTREPWQEAVERSLITLKALTYRPTGGIVAAPTTSLPEHFGGDRNWDYRYCWLRDAAFTLESLLSVGYHDEARAWQEWLLQAVGSDVRDLQIMYGMRGERHLPECELPWLQGYRRSQPVRMGNAASEQMQLDVYGEVADAIVSMKRAGIHLDQRLLRLQRELTDYVASICHLPASGLWEQRDQKKHYTYSKAMAWLALHHGVESTKGRKAREWKAIRDRLHRQICRRGFNRKLGSFVQSFDSTILGRLGIASADLWFSSIQR